MADDPAQRTSMAELLAAWRAAGRDSVAAQAAARIAELALEAATAADEAAREVEEAAKAALDSVQKATNAATKARRAATQAAEAASIMLAAAEGDRARADQEVEVAQHHEDDARDAFHRGEGDARRGPTG